MRSTVQSSAYCRIGDEPMNVAASILIPTSSATRTIGSTPALTPPPGRFQVENRPGPLNEKVSPPPPPPARGFGGKRLGPPRPPPARARALSRGAPSHRAHR